MRIMLAALALSVAVIGSTSGCLGDDKPARQGDAEAKGGCMIGGCSAELCADQELISTCIWIEANACYWQATCERQASGACGWTQSLELTTCLASH